jgi:hypothetical protein
VFKALISDYAKFFKDDQAQLKGRKKTYSQRPDTVDEPSYRGNIQVVTTVEEKLSWFKHHAVDYFDKKLSVEATNASGRAKANLMIGDFCAGELSSQELLALKTFLENKELINMWMRIPVRSDAEIWTKTDEEMYEGRDIYEKPIMSGTKRSLTKEQYILEDPNISKIKDASAYKPQIATKDTPIELGDWTDQEFSGEWTHMKRASLLQRREVLHAAVIEALKKANEVEAVKSEVTGEWLFDYLHRGLQRPD